MHHFRTPEPAPNYVMTASFRLHEAPHMADVNESDPDREISQLFGVFSICNLIHTTLYFIRLTSRGDTSLKHVPPSYLTYKGLTLPFSMHRLLGTGQCSDNGSCTAYLLDLFSRQFWIFHSMSKSFFFTAYRTPVRPMLPSILALTEIISLYNCCHHLNFSRLGSWGDTRQNEVILHIYPIPQSPPGHILELPSNLILQTIFFSR